MNKDKAEKYDKEIRAVDTTCLKALRRLSVVKEILVENAWLSTYDFYKELIRVVDNNGLHPKVSEN